MALIVTLTFVVAGSWGPVAGYASTFVINNLDDPNEGFNDPTPVSPVGGNPGNTLGAQRLNAFQYAADILGAVLKSDVTIQVNAQMNTLTCTSGAAVLGAAGASTVHGNFTNAPMINTLYPQALANSLAGTDLSPANADIAAQFNSNLDLNCFSGGKWYYGYDMNPGSDIDFVTVVLHELCHGLGFQTFVNLSTGAKLGGFNDTYMVRIQSLGASPPDYPSMTNTQRVAASKSDPDLVWVGSNVIGTWPMIPLTGGTNGAFARLHGPNPQQAGSSVSHWSSSLSPNEIMEPFYNAPNHSVGLALALFADIGWQFEPGVEVSVAITRFETRAVADGVEISATFQSQFGATGVNVYRSEGAGSEDFSLIQSLGHDGSSEFTTIDATVEAGKTYNYKIGVTDIDGEFFSPVSRVSIPTLQASLDQNVPNPFNPITSIRYVIPSRQEVRLAVYDAAGRLVRDLVDRSQEPGAYEVVWDGTDRSGNRVGTGIYFYRLQAGKFVQSRKMVLLK